MAAVIFAARDPAQPGDPDHETDDRDTQEHDDQRNAQDIGGGAIPKHAAEHSNGVLAHRLPMGLWMSQALS